MERAVRREDGGSKLITETFSIADLRSTEGMGSRDRVETLGDFTQ